VPLVRILALGSLFFSVPNLLSPYWVKRGYFLLASLTAAVLLIVNVTLNVWWIPPYGSAGAAWATDATYFAGLLLALAMFYYLSRENPLAIFVPQRGDAAIALKTWDELIEKLRPTAPTPAGRGSL
jgi:Na+-driven multidrug efflux pump